jgi:hypothetical protein
VLFSKTFVFSESLTSPPSAISVAISSPTQTDPLSLALTQNQRELIDQDDTNGDGDGGIVERLRVDQVELQEAQKTIEIKTDPEHGGDQLET